MNRALERIGFLLLGGALAVAGERLLSDPSVAGSTLSAPGSETRDDIRARQMDLAEDRLRTDLQLALAGFFRLVGFRDFALEGQAVTVFVATGGAAGRGEVLGSASARGVRVPRIITDADARREWAELGQRLEGLGDGIDPRVLEAFQSVRAFLAEHPLPSGTDYATAARSEWSGAAVVERWEALNRTLASRVVAVLSRSDAGP